MFVDVVDRCFAAEVADTEFTVHTLQKLLLLALSPIQQHLSNTIPTPMHRSSCQGASNTHSMVSQYLLDAIDFAGVVRPVKRS